MTRRTGTTIALTNRQRRDPVPLGRLSALARASVTRLRVHPRGIMSIVFVGAADMRRLNARWTGRRGLTDVLSFRFDADGHRAAPAHEHVIGEIIVAPEAARRYAQAHRLSYHEELARYVVHGLLHWVGHEDRTPAQQRKMRTLEDELLGKNQGN